MANQKPKKQPKSKQLKLTVTERDKWKQILKDVEKNEAPISVLRSLTINLIDGTRVPINIQGLIAAGMEPDILEAEINQKLHELDSVIKDVDFFISLDHVAKTVQPSTDFLLKNL
jgi:hypothetical protein